VQNEDGHWSSGWFTHSEIGPAIAGGDWPAKIPREFGHGGRQNKLPMLRLNAPVPRSTLMVPHERASR
jgi:hypothetical protein